MYDSTAPFGPWTILGADISQHDKKRRAGTGERDHTLSQITHVPLFS